MPQLRQNIITGEWVVIAPERAKRPHDFIIVDTPKDESGSCPFSVKGEQYKQYRLKQFENEHIYVIPNKFPAFLEDSKQSSTRTYKLEDSFYSAKPALGGHDVLVVKEHALTIFNFPQSVWNDLLMITRRRYQYWRQDRKVEYTMAIYNQGTRAGASIVHPHAQIFASNVLPNQVHREIIGSQTYFENNGTCVFCDLLAHEHREKTRVVAENKLFIAFTFYAARFPFEVWILPKAHMAHFEEATNTLLVSLAELMQKVFAQMGSTLKNPPINYYIHDLPNSIAHSDFYHWHIEVAPRVSTYGGFEMGSGVIIDVVSPEDAAKFLRGERQEPSKEPTG